MNVPKPASPLAHGDVADPPASCVPPPAASAEPASADPAPDDVPGDADDDEFEPL